MSYCCSFSGCCVKSSVNNLRSLSVRMHFVVLPPCFWLRVILSFPARETFDLDLGLVFLLKLWVSEPTIKPDRSEYVGVFAESEARMVTWKENNNCINIRIDQNGKKCILYWLLWRGRTLVPGGRPSRAKGFLKVLWKWVLCSNLSLQVRKFSLHFPQRWIPFFWNRKKALINKWCD